MAGTGPPPKPGAIRRNGRVGPLRLPAGGRKGRAPKWPLPDNPKLTAAISIEQATIEELEEKQLDDKLTSAESARLTRAKHRLAVAEETLQVTKKTEATLWRDLWKTPQAVEWDRLGWTREVAQYVRWKTLAECGDLDAGKEARQYADRLGLNPKALRALMWTIDADEVEAHRQERKKPTGGDEGSGGRRRLRAVDGS